MPSGTSLVNKKFGSLTALREAAVADIYVCRCDCGNEVELFRSQLTKKVIRHCGCKATSIRERFEYIKRPLRYKHLRSYHPRSGKVAWRSRCTNELLTYASVLNRCCYKTTPHYPDYGGRGIRICARWRQNKGQGFVNFLDDMGPRPVGKTLDRINVNGHYEPGNCRWADSEVQAENRRYVLEANGVELPPVVPMELDDEALLAGSF